MKFAIIGLGNIAKRVAKGILEARDAQLYAVASRDIQKAIAFQQEFHAQKAYGSYEELLQDEGVDVVYLCTPNNLHYSHILLVLKYHKHVICEKPFLSNQEQLHTCFSYAKEQNCFLMEAEKTLFTPLNQTLMQLVSDGAIGKLRYIEAGYGANMRLDDRDETNWLFRREDGGSFYDVGVYPICYANYFAQAPLENIQLMKCCANLGYDVTTHGTLSYQNGVMAYIRSSWEIDFLNVAVLYGERGFIRTQNFWKNTSAVLCVDGKEEEIQVAMKSDFAGEIEHACSCIAKGWLQSPILNESASAQIMKVLEEMHMCNCVAKEKSVK